MKRKFLNSALNVILIIGFFVLIAKAQERRNDPPENKSTYKEDKVIKDSLFDVAFENQYLITKYINLKPKVKVIEKPVIKYVKVYKVVPIYVPEEDSLAYHETFNDTLSGQYYFDADTVPPIKRSWLYKLLHKNKN